MSQNNSLINLGDLSKPATVLIEKASDAVGGLFKPRQIKRIAKAEAAAALIKAETDIQISEMQHRAMQRLVAEEEIKQRNMESITAKALPFVEDNAKPDDIDNDWIANFFDKCRIVSDEEMQSLWARVLAGEANEPGSFSRQTVNLIQSLDKQQAELFTSLCCFGWNIDGFHPLIFDLNESIYTTKGIDFINLTHLESLGLIKFSPSTGFKKVWGGEAGLCFYYDDLILLRLPKKNRVLYLPTKKDYEMNIGMILLTNIGKELSPICGSKPVDGFLEYTIRHWAKDEIIAYSSLPKLEYR